MSRDLIEHFGSQWHFVRGLTRDLLESLSDQELTATPGLSLGCWWKQFRHMGRVQENYLEAIETRTVRFGIEGTSYSAGPSKGNLLKYLAGLDFRLMNYLQGDIDLKIDWFGEQKSLAQHLMYLADHEVLHHGQWIVYRKQLGGGFPASWSTWGL
jgi:uncharacterized damage-inducible protein DinB